MNFLGCGSVAKRREVLNRVIVKAFRVFGSSWSNGSTQQMATLFPGTRLWVLVPLITLYHTDAEFTLN